MTDPTPPRSDHPAVDTQRNDPTNAFDTPSGRTGQAYSREREAAEGAKHPSGHPLTGDPATVEAPVVDPAGRDIPPESGKRGWIDPDTGEVHGSGSGAGGGNPGETFDADVRGID